MGDYFFLASSISLILLLNLVISSFPGGVEAATGLNTTALQESTDINASVNANKTSENNVVEQSGTIVDVYTNQNTENRYLGGLFLVYLILLIAWLIANIWIG